MHSFATRRAVIAGIASVTMASKLVQANRAESTPVSFEDIDALTGPTVGQASASVRMHLFTDFQCTFCRGFYFETLPFVYQDFVETGEVSLVYHDFPRLGTDPRVIDPERPLLEFADPRNESSLAAQAALSAGEQGKYHHMSDRLFGSLVEPQSGLFLRDSLNRMASAIQLDMDAFNSSMDSGKHVESLAQSVSNGQSMGITATPMFILDNGDGNPEVVQNTAEGYALLKRQIELKLLTIP